MRVFIVPRGMTLTKTRGSKFLVIYICTPTYDVLLDMLMPRSETPLHLNIKTFVFNQLSYLGMYPCYLKLRPTAYGNKFHNGMSYKSMTKSLSYFNINYLAYNNIASSQPLVLATVHPYYLLGTPVWVMWSLHPVQYWSLMPLQYKAKNCTCTCFSLER